MKSKAYTFTYSISKDLFFKFEEPTHLKAKNKNL